MRDDFAFGRAGALCLAAAIVGGGLTPPAFAQDEVDATWDGGVGDWSDTTWTFVPDNGYTDPNNDASTLFDVYIDGGDVGDSLLSLDVNRTIRSLFIDSGDTLGINNNQQLTVTDTITNDGVIGLNSIGNNTRLYVDGAVTLGGTGVLEMSDTTANQIYGTNSAGHLTQQAGHTLRGSGRVGYSSLLQFTNHGLVEANQSQALILTPNSNGVVNTGTFRASNGGTLELASGHTYTNTGGIIEALDGSTVNLTANAHILGGTLQTSGSGVIQSTNATLEGLANTGLFQTVNNSSTILRGTITNTGVMQLNSTGNNTRLYVDGAVALGGTGVLEMSDTTANQIYGTTNDGHLTQEADHTIRGAGMIGLSSFLQFTNHGLVEANQAEALILTPNADGVVNTGTFRASNGGTLQLASGNTYTNTGGIIEALDGSTVNLTGNAHIVGGTLQTSGSGVIQATGAEIENLTNAGLFQTLNNTTTTLHGTITNDGVMELNSTGNSTYYRVDGDVTLDGDGVLEMSNDNGNQIFGTTSAGHLTQQADHTIRGAGRLGFSSFLQFTNYGLVEANQNQALILTPNSNGFANTGTFRATNGGTLELASTFTYTNTGGVIEALDGSTVKLTGNAHILGGTLQTSGSGAFQATGAEIENLTNAGLFQTLNNTTTILRGTITNDGVMQLNSTGNSTYYRVDGDVTLAGTGILEMSNNDFNFIYGTTNDGHLTQEADHTIRGAGMIGLSSFLQFTNHGVVEANQTENLYIQPNADGFTNHGTLRATGGGSLIFTHNYLNNLDNNTLTGGTYEVIGNSAIHLPGHVHTNAANIRLDGAGSMMYYGTGTVVDILADLDDNQGSFTITNGRDFNTAGDFNNSGTLHVGTGSTFTVNTANTLTSTGTLSGFGTIVGDVDSTGLLSPGNSIGTLNIDGGLTVNSGSSYDWHIDSTGADLMLITTGDLTFTGGVLTINILVGDDGLPADGLDHALFTVADGAIAGLETMSVSLNLPENWAADGLIVSGNDVLLTNLTVPEPTSLALLGMGGLALLARRRRAVAGA